MLKGLKNFKSLKIESSLIKIKRSCMPTGKVKWFNSKKGYGFITEDETNKDIFLHVSALEKSKLKTLKEEQQLEFEIKNENNKLQATNLKKT
jgi:CspA family cold shock protein